MLSSCTSTGGGTVELAAASLQAAPLTQPQFSPTPTAQAPGTAQQTVLASAQPLPLQPPSLADAKLSLNSGMAQPIVITPSLAEANATSLLQPQAIETTSGNVIPVPLSKETTARSVALAPVQPIIITTQPHVTLVTPEVAPQPIPDATKSAHVAATQVAEITAEPAVQNLTAAPAELAPAKPPRKKSLFESMFGSSNSNVPQKIQKSPEPLPADTQLALADPTPSPAFKGVALAGGNKKPNLALAKLEQPADSLSVDSAPAVNNGDLPGVRKGALFEIKRRDANGNDLDVDISETDNAPVLLASAAGLARLAPNGLRVQRETVDVACLKPQLVKMLKTVEGHYGQSLIITSGYRSPGHNRQVRGAKNSLHMFCAAADFQVPGVSKWDLAKYLRSMPGRGGVGTYCNTESVHIDVGPDRDWNWRCSRRK